MQVSWATLGAFNEYRYFLGKKPNFPFSRKYEKEESANNENKWWLVSRRRNRKPLDSRGGMEAADESEPLAF